MSPFDLGCAIAAAAAAFGGWRQGIVVRLVTGAGALVGLLFAARNVDAIALRLPRADSSPRLVGVLLSLLIGWVAGRFIGGIVGRWVRNRLPETLIASDRAIGSAAGVCGVLFTVWLAAPVMQLLPGWPSSAVGDSVVVRQLDRSVGFAPLPIDPSLWPTPGELTGSVAKSVGGSVGGRLGGPLGSSAGRVVVEDQLTR